jgi:hypothetical protein
MILLMTWHWGHETQPERNCPYANCGVSDADVDIVSFQAVVMLKRHDAFDMMWYGSCQDSATSQFPPSREHHADVSGTP